MAEGSVRKIFRDERPLDYCCVEGRDEKDTVEKGDKDEEDCHRRVRFSVPEETTTIFIESYKLYTANERSDYWESPRELVTRRSRLQQTIRNMGFDEEYANQPQNRGLVRWTKRGWQFVQTQTLRTLHAVMDEQDRQWESGVDDFERIAALSQGTTAVTIRNAKHLALQDEQEAMSIQICCLFTECQSLVENEKEERDNLDNGAATKSVFAGGLEDFFSSRPDISSLRKKRSKRKSKILQQTG